MSLSYVTISSTSCLNFSSICLVDSCHQKFHSNIGSPELRIGEGVRKGIRIIGLLYGKGRNEVGTNCRGTPFYSHPFKEWLMKLDMKTCVSSVMVVLYLVTIIDVKSPNHPNSWNKF